LGQNLNKWCTYGSWGKDCPSFLGKLESYTSKNSALIRYSERQLFPLECWDINYVTVFDTIEEAILFLLQYSSSRTTLNELREYWSFPSDKDKIDWDDLKQKELDMIRNHRFKFNKNVNS
jgi:hypothetical protein